MIGTDRLVWGFPGLGGKIVDSTVWTHLVKQQPTVVQSGAVASATALGLLDSTRLPVHQEHLMHDWFDAHNVFIAGMAAAILNHTDGAEHVATDRAAATHLVRALREGFAALEHQGIRIRPQALRTIFGPVPTPLAAAYWKRQFSTPMVTLSMEPHARATQHTEMAAVFDRALELVGDRAPRYSTFIEGVR